VFVKWAVVCLLWDSCVCNLDCGVLAEDVFVNWTMECLLFDRCVCK
jgi:hypothetical protein